MNRIVVALVVVFPLVSLAQKKEFTFDQLFHGQFPAVFNPIPDITGWADDDHYLVHEDSAGHEVTYSVDALSGKTTPYTFPDTAAKLPNIEGAKNITASPDKKYVAYTLANNLYIRDLASGKETAVTHDGSDSVLNGYASWVYYEEILGRVSHYRAFWWSPDSKRIAFMHFDDSKVPQFPIYVATGQHGYLEKERYPKVGDKNPEVKIGIVTVDNSNTIWADFNSADDQYFGQPEWTPNNELWVQWMNRKQDSLVVFEINQSSGAKRNIYTEKQDTWISLDDLDRFTFLPVKKQMIMKSDRDGWENLYLYDLNGKLISPITKGNFWSTEILLTDEKNKQVYFQARRENSTHTDVYKAGFDGKAIVKLTPAEYSNDAVFVSPSGKYFAAMFSNTSTAPKIALYNNKGKLIRQIADLKGPEFDRYSLPKTVIKKVRSSDDQFDLPMSITYPVNFDSTKKYPVWITVYGGPDVSLVYDTWRTYGGIRQWWAQQGIIQVVMDNRASGHFGRKGMNYIYRKLGKWEIEDFMTCGKWLRAQPWVDTNKVGITGGSFGGYITCMALTYGADVFTHGIAQYSVVDWHLYDTHYTERYMNKPDENPEGYRETSVLSYVQKYRGMLRIVHGSTDDNVHLQNSIQLIDTLENMNRDFELMIYPGQRHGIGSNKAQHNNTEAAKFIYRYLLGKEMPESFRE